MNYVYLLSVLESVIKYYLSLKWGIIKSTISYVFDASSSSRQLSIDHMAPSQFQ